MPRPLTRTEAVARAALLTVHAMEVDLDLDRGSEVFGSRATIRFTCHAPGASTFVDVRARELHAVARTLAGRGRGLAGMQLGLTPTAKF